jgi:hypothetical protein
VRPRRLSRVVVRPLNFIVRTHAMRTATGQPLRRALRILCAGALLLSAVGCADDCDRIVGPEFRSPNGQWTARAKRSTCGGAVLALGSDSTVVELTRHKRNYGGLSGVVLSAESLNAEDLKIRWVSNYELELTLPAHSNIDVLVASYYGIDVAVKFTPSDPAERARWIEYERARADWADQMIAWDRKRAADPSSAGPPPPTPRLQAAKSQ